MKRKKLLCLLLAVLMLLTTGCSRDAYAGEGKLEENPVSPPGMDSEWGGSQENAPAADSRKWIVTVSIQTETEDLDALLADISRETEACGGYLGSQQVYNGSAYSGRRSRSAEITVRVPAEQADGFLAKLSGISNVTARSQTKEDVTLQYVATESRVKTLEAEEARLRELMEKAGSLTDLLEIEARLTNVRYELENIASQLRVLENQIDYATIRLSIEEVAQYTPGEDQTFWQRIGTGFMGSLKDLGGLIVELLVFFVSKLPYLAVLGGVITGIVLLCRHSDKKRKPKNPPQTPMQQ